MKQWINNPAFLVCASFLAVILVGTGLLLLPGSTVTPLSGIDAFFTAVSATCVTGLIVKDTAVDFTPQGQVVILFLIQVGGLGILTFSAFFISAITGRLGIRGASVLEDTMTQDFITDFGAFLRRTLAFVLTAEAAGGAVLTVLFAQDHSWLRAMALGFFHSVSAFCNAGFSLFSNSLEGYTTHWGVNLAVIFLIILGGIGFVVIEEIQKAMTEKSGLRALSFHSRVVLGTTGILLIGGTLLVLLVEHGGGFRHLSVPERILAAFFQSVTSRTAGFSTIPIDLFSNATLFLLMMLMFIGGSPGSTAGGVKTTSFAVFIALVVSRFRNRKRPEILSRTVSYGTMERLLTLLAGASLVLAVSIFSLTITEAANPAIVAHPRSFLALCFEAFSAFGTVGLSTGITPHLTTAGKIILCVLMFLGRTGPLTLAVLISSGRREYQYEYPEEDIIIG
ncbi:MAG: potassium transporter [Candidatus Hydrogenedentota bacterium]|nr:MAG: potassium transporter [Candidatus Hydrogenedentota bacterium]